MRVLDARPGAKETAADSDDPTDDPSDRTRLLRVVSMLAILFFYLAYVAAQLDGAGQILNASFGIPHWGGMLIGATVVAGAVVGAGVPIVLTSRGDSARFVALFDEYRKAPEVTRKRCRVCHCEWSSDTNKCPSCGGDIPKLSGDRARRVGDDAPLRP